MTEERGGDPRGRREEEEEGGERGKREGIKCSPHPELTPTHLSLRTDVIMEFLYGI